MNRQDGSLHEAIALFLGFGVFVIVARIMVYEVEWWRFGIAYFAMAIAQQLANYGARAFEARPRKWKYEWRWPLRRVPIATVVTQNSYKEN